MRFYVAGKFQEYEKVRGVIDKLKAQGHTVTYDWTRTPEFDDAGHPRQSDPHKLRHTELQAYATRDLEGVEAADFVVICADAEGLCGAWMEMGVALVTPSVRAIFVVDPARWTIFMSLDKVQILSSYESLFLVTSKLFSWLRHAKI